MFVADHDSNNHGIYGFVLVAMHGLLLTRVGFDIVLGCHLPQGTPVDSVCLPPLSLFNFVIIRCRVIRIACFLSSVMIS